MPTPVSSAKQCLTQEAAITLDDAVAVAARRGHTQTTSLHFISSLLSLSSSCLREACSRTRNNAYSVRVQFKALELCLGVSMDRLPSSPNKIDDPPVSNSLMAAIKRSQANQRRQPENFNFYQQLQQQNHSASCSSVPIVKVELRNLIISVLDDPVVSRVFGEAGFRSCDIKLAILRPVHQLFRYSRFRTPPLFLCNLSSQTDSYNRSFSFPFLGFSGGEDDCRRIGEVFIKNRGKNPLLLGTFAHGAMNSFLEMVEMKKGGGILSLEVCGLSVISIENEILRFVTGECDEELVKLKFEEIGTTVMHSIGSGLVVNYGDLKVLARDDSSIDSCRYIVSKLISLLEIYHGKLWLIGWVERYEIYLKVLNRFPYIEKDWDLQILTITSKEESFPRSSLMESFVPFGGLFSAPAADDDIKSCSYQSASRCHLCNEKCKQEINTLSNTGFSGVSVAHHCQSSLPSWLQMTDQLRSNGGLDAIKAKDDKMVLGAKIAGLQRKWDNLCQRLHYNQPLSKTSSFQLASQVPSVVGFQVIDQDQNEGINDDKSSHTNASSAETGRKIMNSTVSSSNESSPLGMISEAGNDKFLSKFSETPSKSVDERGLNSPASVTSVTTDLGLSVASTSPGKEQEQLTNQSSINQAHNISCNVSASAEVVSGGFFNRSPLSSSSNSLQCLHKQLDPKDIKMLYAALMEKVAWQEEAVNAISHTIAQCRSRNERSHCTRRGDIWLNFLGPDKIGKKKVMIALAEILYGSTNNLICVDLSLQDDVGLFDLQVLNRYDVKFRGKHVVDYVAEKLRNNPLSVVFLENVDKADLLVQKSLSQAVKTGRFSDSHGREVSIANAIFVTTSSRLDEETTLHSTKEISHDYSEEDILAAKGSQIQMLIAFDLADDVENPNSSTLVTSKKRSSSRIIVNKRKLTGSSESVHQQCGSSEMAKRAHKESNTCLDLNLPAEETENYDTFNGDSGCDSWLKELFAQFDETAIFRPFDFDSLAEKLLKEIRLCFHKIVGPECLLEMDTKVLEQILAATCLTDRKKVEDWIQHVLSKGFVEAQERYSLSARSVVKLVTCESSFQEVHIPGVLLPSRIIVN
ncbi:PREDICTED: protein SMAX1-LIKE 6-like [Nicotiana attenuata]|uniref:Protein smax1-like 7 n=1 Tax=Nicotiana attenuata TaxID=49451 RepID=A0A1J6KP18_NICAT|nr:PREDICTED: protein SMAX1-LIKE 6-like [Nicotiana attenuata]OIT20929.1 protein smax1-like 7 [Nicotiana attenuata]